MLSVTLGSDGRLTAEPSESGADETFVDELPSGAQKRELVGRWRHFKGGEYDFVGLVDESPDGPLVLYIDANRRVWLRPLGMIDEVVERGEWRGRRFTRVGPTLRR
jgi:hypothetical protein